MIQLQALSIGPSLNLFEPREGFVHSVFARAANLEMSGNLWTLLLADGADLPMGIRVAAQDFWALKLREGDQVNVKSGFIGIRSGDSGYVVDCRAAPQWIPVHPDRLEPGLARRIAVVTTKVRGRSWGGSAQMAHAIRSALETPDAIGNVMASVVGRGPGLTPAGDDVLVGILAVLNSPHSGFAGAKIAKTLGRLVVPLLPTTSRISGQLLRQAANGRFGRVVHELLSALIEDQLQRKLAETVRRILETGATSGADTCEGLLALAPTFLVPRDTRVAV
jgi:Protein of unknown function (DUF2877)